MMFTKVSGVLLATLLVIFGLKEAAHIVYHPHELEEPAYPIEVPEEVAGGAPVEEAGPVDFGTLIPAADPAAGEAAARKCLACHTFNAGGPIITGPNLHDVLGRPAASVAGFSYSEAMRNFGSVWDYQTLYDYLENPRAYLPGTAMVFAGLPNEEERIAMIAYLRQINEAAAPPLPEPLAAAAPADAAAAAAADGEAASPEGETTGEAAGASDTAAAGASEDRATDAAEQIDDAEAALSEMTPRRTPKRPTNRLPNRRGHIANRKGRPLRRPFSVSSQAGAASFRPSPSGLKFSLTRVPSPGAEYCSTSAFRREANWRTIVTPAPGPCNAADRS
jgi:cytochrome c